MNEKLRILVADDHEMVRKGLRTVLESKPGWQICGEAEDGRQAVNKARELRPDIVVLDLTMPGLNGLEATRRICSTLPDTQVLVLTMHDSEQLMYEVLAAGARGYVLKSDAGTAIYQAVESLQKGKPYFTSKMSEVLLQSYLHPESTKAASASEPLTSREREIVQLIAEGKSTKEVASVLGISTKTAETHRTNLMRKLHIHSVSEIVRYAIRNHIIEP